MCLEEFNIPPPGVYEKLKRFQMIVCDVPHNKNSNQGASMPEDQKSPQPEITEFKEPEAY